MERIDLSKAKANDTSQEAINYGDVMKKSFVDVTQKLVAPPVCLSMGEYLFKGSYYPIPFATFGNISCLVGASKSMKTFLKSAVVAGVTGGQTNNYFPDFRSHKMQDKFILDVDTEQASYHAQKVFKRSCDMVGAISPYYKPYAIRELSPKERFQFVEYLILESEYRGNIGFVSVDGIADCVEDSNSLIESNKVVQGFMKWSSVENCHIMSIIHKNFGSDKPTGFLGSSLLKKSETVAFVQRENDLTKVTPNYTRNMPFDEFHFNLDENFLPKIADSSPKPF